MIKLSLLKSLLKSILPGIILFIMADHAIAGYNDFRAVTRYDYYTTGTTGEVLVIVPQDLLSKEIKIDLAFRYRFLTKGYSIGTGHACGLVPFPLEPFDHGSDTVICSFYVNDVWVHSVYVMVTKLPPAPNEVKIDRYSGGMMVDGRPFFPYGFYCTTPVDPTLMVVGQETGFNTVTFCPDQKRIHLKECQAYMDRCAAAGMKVNYNVTGIVNGRDSDRKGDARSHDKGKKILRREILALRDHPALLAWSLVAGQENAGISPDSVKTLCSFIRMLDPYHPVSVLFSDTLQAIGYGWESDVVMMMTPVIRDTVITDAELAVRALRNEFYPYKPLWIVPHTSSDTGLWKDGVKIRERCTAQWLAIVSGATGIQIVMPKDPCHTTPSLMQWAEDSRMAFETAELTSFLLQYDDQPQYECSIKEIRVKGWIKDSATIILAVNMVNQPLNVTLDTGDTTLSGDVEVMYENRRVISDHGRINDIIDGYGIRIYKLSRPR
jgi:hypothetical protein